MSLSSTTKSTTIFLLLLIICLSCLFSLSNCSIPSQYQNQLSKAPHTVHITTPSKLQAALKEKKALLFFTVGPALKAQCPYCDNFKQEYEKLATQYWNGRNRNYVFFVVEYQQNMMSLIQGLGLRQVPALFNIGSKQMCDIGSKRMQDCIRDWTGVKLNVASSVPQQKMPPQGAAGQSAQQQASAAYQTAQSIRTILFLLFFVGVAVALYAARKIGALPMFLICGGWCVYLASLGGIVYNWINTPPPYQMGQNGPAFFYPSHMQQLSLEGFISGAMMLLNAVSFLALTQFIPSLKSSWTRRVWSSVLIATWLGTTVLVVGFFLLKNSWYMSSTPFSPYLQMIKKLMG